MVQKNEYGGSIQNNKSKVVVLRSNFLLGHSEAAEELNRAQVFDLPVPSLLNVSRRNQHLQQSTLGHQQIPSAFDKKKFF